MSWMNDMEVEESANRYQGHPVLEPATLTLVALANAVNSNSDGWHSWPAPAKAARKLMDLIQGVDHPGGIREAMYDDERADATVARLKAAYTPIRSFRTRAVAGALPGLGGHGFDFEIVEPGSPVVSRELY